jgi:uncharacterized membrane protein YecN with MAPEG domain
MHISLFSAGIAGLIAVWHAIRCIKLRFADKAAHGDGGSARLARRMRAHANFAEYTPIALVLIVLLDLMDAHAWVLGPVALAFLLGRVLHAIGMDSETAAWPRQIGMLLTLPVLAGLAIWAMLLGAKII